VSWVLVKSSCHWQTFA